MVKNLNTYIKPISYVLFMWFNSILLGLSIDNGQSVSWFLLLTLLTMHCSRASYKLGKPS